MSKDVFDKNIFLRYVVPLRCPCPPSNARCERINFIKDGSRKCFVKNLLFIATFFASYVNMCYLLYPTSVILHND